jgi:dTDP-4-amino-4,6-dideoxygalactose transaminase
MAEPTAEPKAGQQTGDVRFNIATLMGNELAYVEESMRSGLTTSSGPFAQRAGELLQTWLHAEEILLTTSCTAALEMSALLLDLQPGDAVMVPSFTFSTTALAFARQGARIIFCDIEDQTLGADPGDVERQLLRAEAEGVRVRALVVVHYAGVACRLDELQAVLDRFPGVGLVEDNAHALYGRHRGRPLGTFGRFAAQSFHATKNFSCGEGGALVVNDVADVDRARVLYDKGTNRRAFMLGQVDKYSWVDNGSSFGLSDVLAAHLLGQLEQAERIQARRAAICAHYRAALADVAADGIVRLPYVPETAESAHHMFYVVLDDRASRDRVLKSMNADGVRAVFHYVPLHSSVAGRRFAAWPADCPVSDDISGRLLRLPLHLSLTEQDIDRVVTSFTSALLP